MFYYFYYSQYCVYFYDYFGPEKTLGPENLGPCNSRARTQNGSRTRARSLFLSFNVYIALDYNGKKKKWFPLKIIFSEESMLSMTIDTL